MEFSRSLNLKTYIEKKSYFLFGPRSTGKSFLIKTTLGENAEVINLLNPDFFLRLSQEPNLLRAIVERSKKGIVVIDEVQKIPILLDVVHDLLESSLGKTFLLTGSSTRKLKRENANFLGGRAGQLYLNTLSFSEISNFDLDKFLRWGGLPRVYLSDDPHSELAAYASTYLEQDIQIEAQVRNLTTFSRFLKVAALSNSELVNFTNIGNDSGVAPSTVREYYKILEDTLIGFLLEPFVESKKRKAIQTSKFYFFDPGVCHYLAGFESLERDTDIWGRAFEQFIALELRSYLQYKQKKSRLCFWRSINKHEVDFVIGNQLAIEVKSTKKVTSKHYNGLKALKEEKLIQRFLVISCDPITRKDGDFEIFYWKYFLKELWEDKFEIR